ncbi:MAG: hypothetical protein ABIF88_00175 [archaeon]
MKLNGGKKNKKAQAWSLDAIIATFIFVIGIAVIFVYAVNSGDFDNRGLENLFFQGNTLSEMVLDEMEPGILSGDTINQTKLNEFYNLDYETKKDVFGVKDEFYIKLEGLEIDGAPADYIGKLNDTEVRNLVVVSRLTIYKNIPIIINFNIWNS